MTRSETVGEPELSLQRAEDACRDREVSQTQLKKLHEGTEVPVQKLQAESRESSQRQEEHKQTVVDVDINTRQESDKPATLVTERVATQTCATLHMNNQTLTVLTDTADNCNVLSTRVSEQNLNKCCCKLVKPLGQKTITCKHKDKELNVDF